MALLVYLCGLLSCYYSTIFCLMFMWNIKQKHTHIFKRRPLLSTLLLSMMCSHECADQCLVIDWLPPVVEFQFCSTVWSTTSWQTLEHKASETVWQSVKTSRRWGKESPFVHLSTSVAGMNLTAVSPSTTRNRMWNECIPYGVFERLREQDSRILWH